MPGWFELSENDDGRFRFVVNGAGIDSVRANGSSRTVKDDMGLY